MKVYVESIVDYLELKLRRWTALLSGIFSGVAGVLGLVFLTGIFLGVTRVATLLPFIVGYTAANAGYKTWEKSTHPDKIHRNTLAGIAGIVTSLVAFVVQYKINQYFFGAQTPWSLLILVLAVGVVMSQVGAWLNSRVKKGEETGQ